MSQPSPQPVDTVRTPSWGEVIANGIYLRLRDTHVMVPGQVVDYDAGSQTATIQPSLKSPVLDPYGNVLVLSKPLISHVPIMFPSGGGMRMTFPIQANDYVALVFSDQSLDIWRSYGGEVDPIDLRIHDIGDCVAFPGLHPDNAAWSNVDGSHIQIGKDGSSPLAVARNTDSVSWSMAFGTWISAVTSYINGLVPGTLNQQTNPIAAISSGSSTVQILG